MKKIIVSLLCVITLVIAVGCGAKDVESQNDTTVSSGQESASDGAVSKYAEESAEAANVYANDTYFDNYENYKDFDADGVYKVAFVCKFLTSQWFAPKSGGMQAEADKLGVEYIGIDSNNTEDAFLQGVQNAINQEVDAVIMTPVTASMLPTCVDMCKEAGVAYITTDDGGYDFDGNRVPHLGLDDYGLCYSAGRAGATAAIVRNFDVSSLKIVMLDAPAIESIHNRSLGAYQGMMDNIPGLSDDNFVWLDTIDNLTDNNIAKFSSAYQANAAETESWIVFCGGNNVWDAAFPIFDENDIDYSNVICCGVCSDTTVAEAMSDSKGKTDCMFCAGILPAPSGAALIDLCYSLFTEGKAFPDFVGYPEYIVSADNIDEWCAEFE